MARMDGQFRHQPLEEYEACQLTDQPESHSDDAELQQATAGDEHQNPGNGASDDGRDQCGIQQLESMESHQSSAECVHRDRRRDVDPQNDDQRTCRRHETGAHMDERGQHDGDDDGHDESGKPQDREREEGGVDRLFQGLVVSGRMLATDERHGGAGEPKFHELEVTDDRAHEDPDPVSLVPQVLGEHRGCDEGNEDGDDGEGEARQSVPAESFRHVHRRHVADRFLLRKTSVLWFLAVSIGIGGVRLKKGLCLRQGEDQPHCRSRSGRGRSPCAVCRSRNGLRIVGPSA